MSRSSTLASCGGVRPSGTHHSGRDSAGADASTPGMSSSPAANATILSSCCGRTETAFVYFRSDWSAPLRLASGDSGTVALTRAQRHGDAHAALINLSTLDREALQTLVVGQQSELGALEEKLLSCDNDIEHLKLVIAKLRRMIASGPRIISSPTPMPVARAAVIT